MPRRAFDAEAFRHPAARRHDLGGFACPRRAVGLSLDAFEADWQRHWLVQRGIEIISEASRHLPADLKVRHPEIPWTKVAGIGNVLRHGYEDIAAPILWKLVREDLPQLEQVCRDELAAEQGREQP